MATCRLFRLTWLQLELSSDPTIRTHLAELYDKLLEQNLLRIVEPYSVVELDYVAQQVGQGRQAVEVKYVVLVRYTNASWQAMLMTFILIADSRR